MAGVDNELVRMTATAAFLAKQHHGDTFGDKPIEWFVDLVTRDAAVHLAPGERAAVLLRLKERGGS